MHTIFLYIISSIFVLIKSTKVEVKTDQGVFFGVREITLFEKKMYFGFYGVPYAKAPVGQLRFKNPKALKGARKPFDGSAEYHGACAQAHIVHKQSLYGNEDCLHLNIYTSHLPNDKIGNLKAVIVWIHGYAFTSSFSHVYGPDFLIENEVLLVSLTHRIGAFGFLKINETDTNVNMGLKDIIIGLKWIRKNIKHFGGDKDRITLMGSGSGGTFASLLLLTKHRKLFQKLIIQSGSIFSPSIFQSNITLESFKLQKEILKSGIKDFRTAPTDDLVAASNKIYSYKDFINIQRPIVPFSPILEKESKYSLLTKLYFDEYEKGNEQFNIPILTGFTSQESISEAMPFIHSPSHLKSLGTYFKFMVPFSNGCSYNYSSKTYSSIANKIIQRYFKNYPDISLEELLKYSTDLHKYPIYKFIKTHLKQSKRKMYVYKFNYIGKFNVMKSTSLAGTNIRVKGAAHGDELCYILKCEPLWESYLKITNEIGNRERIFMNQIATMWANFAKFGDPTPPYYNSNITWLPMTSKEDNLILFGKEIVMTNSRIEAKMFKFWNKLYDDYYTPDHCSIDHDEL